MPEPYTGPVPVLLVRHGQTDWNLARRVQGRTDIPLNDVGRDEAAFSGSLLAGGGWPKVVTSTLSRAAETGDIIAAALGVAEPTRHAGLVERNYGEAEGFTVDDFHSLGREPAGLEPWSEVAERAIAALRALIAADPTPLVAVAHGGLLRSVLLTASGGEHPPQGHPIENGAIAAIAFDGDEVLFLRGAEHEPISLAEAQEAARNVSISSAASRGAS